jgi:hypothetical protein
MAEVGSPEFANFHEPVISARDTRAPDSPETRAANSPGTGALPQPGSGPPADPPPQGPDRDSSENELVDLGRLAWLGTVLICLITVLVLILQGYLGYAAVTFAVAVAAAINLF